MSPARFFRRLLFSGLVLYPGLVLRAAEDATASAPHNPRIVLVGDSTVTDESGWGYGFKRFVPDTVECLNTSRGGRSSKTFIEEGHWKEALAAKGDYYLIQFGHNDELGKWPPRETDPATTFPHYMSQYIDEARAIGAEPILVTSLTRRKFEADKHTLAPSLVDYADAVLKLAAEKHVPVVDLHARSIDLCQRLGEDLCATISARTAENRVDGTHLNSAGSLVFARLVVDELRRVAPPLAALLKSEPTPLPADLKPNPLNAPKAKPGAPGAAADEPPAPPPAPVPPPADRPSLYVIGDSTAAKSTRTITIQGWGEPFLDYFDPAKINVVNAARGGRSTRTFITEGSLDALVAKLKPGDIVLVQFGHNDVFPLNDNVARGTLHGLGDETEEIDNGLIRKHEIVHTFGWYLKKMVADIRANGARPILLTLTLRFRYNADGSLERTPDPTLDLANTNRFTAPSIYSVWTSEVAKSEHVPLLDVHNLIADRYEKDGRAIVANYFNNPRDPTHRDPLGAALDAELTLSALRTLEGKTLDPLLSSKGRTVPPAAPRYVIPAHS